VELVRELAERTDEPAATTLTHALEAGRAVIALTVLDREQILWALDVARMVWRGIGTLHF